MGVKREFSHRDFARVAEIRNSFFQDVAAISNTAKGHFEYVGGTDNHFYGHDGTNPQQLPWATDNGIFKPLATPPAAPTAGETWYETTNNVLQFNDGTTTHTVATTALLANMYRTRSTAYDASLGALPTAADNNVATWAGEPLAQDDVFIIGTGGEITGIGGDDVLEPFDMLVLVDPANPTVAASWVGINRNLDLPTALLVYENVATALVADTDFTITPTTITAIQGVQMYDDADQSAESMVVTVAAGAGTATVNSLVALTGRALVLGTV